MCRRQGPEFAEPLSALAEEYGVAHRALTVRTLLHLPRLARSDGTLGEKQVRVELKRNAERLRRDHQTIGALIPSDRYSLTDLKFVRLGGAEAHQIFSTLHYLRSARAGSLNFALVDPVRRLPVTLCSVSPLEWVRVGRQLQSQFGVPLGAAWDVSRVYSFDVAPVNAISYLLSKVRQAIRREIPGVQLLTTAVDPNLGFGGANLAELRNTHRDHRFEQSRANLLDSLIFCCRLRGETEQVAPAEYRLLRR